jgi:hypothetical protein
MRFRGCREVIGKTLETDHNEKAIVKKEMAATLQVSTVNLKEISADACKQDKPIAQPA